MSNLFVANSYLASTYIWQSVYKKCRRGEVVVVVTYRCLIIRIYCKRRGRVEKDDRHIFTQFESVGHIGKQHFGSHKSHLGQTVHFEKLRILHSHLPVIMHYLSLIAKAETNMSFDNNVHKTIPNDCINWLSGECFGIAFATL